MKRDHNEMQNVPIPVSNSSRSTLYKKNGQFSRFSTIHGSDYFDMKIIIKVKVNIKIKMTIL